MKEQKKKKKKKVVEAEEEEGEDKHTHSHIHKVPGKDEKPQRTDATACGLLLMIGVPPPQR